MCELLNYGQPTVYILKIDAIHELCYIKIGEHILFFLCPRMTMTIRLMVIVTRQKIVISKRDLFTQIPDESERAPDV